MAKKINAEFTAELCKNNVKAGAWIAEFSVTQVGLEAPTATQYTAWSNASAGKRWIKEMVLAHTPKKSIKMIADGELDEKGKPVCFKGALAFKIEA